MVYRDGKYGATMHDVRGLSKVNRGKGMRVHDMQLIVCHDWNIRSRCHMKVVWPIWRCSERSWGLAGVGGRHLFAVIAVVYRGGEYGVT